jgi:hypothetical protein
MKTLKGNQLHPDDVRHVLASYVHRYTMTHRPAWANREDSKNCLPQFKDDADWLANTEFAVKKDGRLDKRVKSCTSSPTWPMGKVKLRTISNTEALLEIHAPGVRLQAEDWSEEEYITYDPNENAIVDEDGERVNALVFVINYTFYVIQERE